jgi:signal transduction histidine kinase
VTRRIVFAMIAVTLVAIGVFALPLAVAVETRYRDDEVGRLQQLASAATIAVPGDTSVQDPIELPVRPARVELGVYDERGRLVAGEGPAIADATVSQALSSGSVTAERGETLVAAAPVNADERTVAVVRAAESEDATDAAVHRAWLGMAALAALALVTAVGVGLVLARRLVRPLRALRDGAQRLGEGDFGIRHEPSGIAEIDDAGDALDATAHRLGDLVERERAVSADASHQLRTPLTGLRTVLEAELAAPREDPTEALHQAIGQVDRLERTIDDLLALAREQTQPVPCRVNELLVDARLRWRELFRDAGRSLRVDDGVTAPEILASPSAIAQVLDVLIDNGLRHGEGAVSVEVSPSPPGTVSITVVDEGSGIDGPADTLFRRNAVSGDGHGIGLALAQTLAEADGGRVEVGGSNPSSFVLTLPSVT